MSAEIVVSAIVVAICYGPLIFLSVFGALHCASLAGGRSHRMSGTIALLTLLATIGLIVPVYLNYIFAGMTATEGEAGRGLRWLFWDSGGVFYIAAAWLVPIVLQPIATKMNQAIKADSDAPRFPFWFAAAVLPFLACGLYLTFT